MKSIRLFLVTLVAMFSLSCTHNDGNIGPWFGTWKMTEMTVDGVKSPDYHDDIIWKFQSAVVSILQVDDTTHSVYDSTGSWTQQGNLLTLNFLHSDNHTGDNSYIPPSVTQIPHGIAIMNIVKLSSKEIVLSYTTESGSLIRYTLNKWG